MLFKKQNIIFFLVLLTTVLSSPLEVKAQWKLDVKGTVKNEDTKTKQLYFSPFSVCAITEKGGFIFKLISTFILYNILNES